MNSYVAWALGEAAPREIEPGPGTLRLVQHVRRQRGTDSTALPRDMLSDGGRELGEGVGISQELRQREVHPAALVLAAVRAVEV
eukprot:1619282-Rhodomonas_salina.2